MNPFSTKEHSLPLPYVFSLSTRFELIGTDFSLADPWISIADQKVSSLLLYQKSNIPSVSPRMNMITLPLWPQWLFRSIMQTGARSWAHVLVKKLQTFWISNRSPLQEATIVRLAIASSIRVDLESPATRDTLIAAYWFHPWSFRRHGPHSLIPKAMIRILDASSMPCHSLPKLPSMRSDLSPPRLSPTWALRHPSIVRTVPVALDNIGMEINSLVWIPQRQTQPKVPRLISWILVDNLSQKPRDSIARGGLHFGTGISRLLGDFYPDDGRCSFLWEIILVWAKWLAGFPPRGLWVLIAMATIFERCASRMYISDFTLQNPMKDVNETWM